MLCSERYRCLTGREYLYNIQSVHNLRSIIDHGILSHNLANTMDHVSIANMEVQDRRERIILPCGNRLHDYANLYFDYWNPMLYTLCRNEENKDKLCIIEIDLSILDIDGIYVTSANAAKYMAEFYKLPIGIDKPDYDAIFQKYWYDGYPEKGYDYDSMKGIKNAEVLVPNLVSQNYIKNIIVCRNIVLDYIHNSIPNREINVCVNPTYFF